MTFNLAEAEQLREQGMAQAANSRRAMLELARIEAARIALEQGEVTSDDVYEALQSSYGIDPALLGNAAGSVFRGGFTFTGRWKKSNRITNHARMNRVWELNTIEENG